MTRRLRHVGRSLALLAVAAYLLSFATVLVVSRRDDRRPADAIVVLGAAQYNGRPSPVFRARLDHALALWRDSVSARVIVTGGRAEGDRESEAAVGLRYLRDQGLPAAATAAVPVGNDTEGSMAAVAGWMRGEGLATAVLVSDPFHLLRLKLEARRVGLRAWTSPTTTSPISASRRRELGYLATEALKVPVALGRTLAAGLR